MKSKYIKTKDNKIIMFPEMMNHSDFKHMNPVTAGFVTFNDDGNQITVQTYGKSLTLNLHSDPDDAMLIKCQFNEY